MKNYIRALILILAVISNVTSFSQDTSYIGIAPEKVQRMLIPGKAPVATIQFSAFYDNGLMDLAASDNTNFNESDFINGRNFGTRHGFGISLTGKIALHKEGNIRLNVTAMYNRMQSNFLISATPQGRVSYNVFSGALGLEDNFSPDRPFKPYMSFDVVPSFITGSAVLSTDSTDFNLTIKNTFRLGLDLNLGFEYAITNNFGFNVGMKLTHVNLFFKESKATTNINETYLNDAQVTPAIPYSGWKQFFFGSIYTGVNFYFGMKNRK
jgi:hypothetical protein